MKRLSCEITIQSQGGKIYRFDYVKDLEIKRSRYNVTDTAEIVIPKVIKVNQAQALTGSGRVFKRGDAVTIRLGYHPNLETRFEGFISKIEVKDQMTLICEDHSYLLKEKVIPKLTLMDTTLRGLLKEISPIPFTAADTKLGDLRLTNVTAAQVLDELRSTYGIMSWIEGGRLICGLLYEDRNPTPVTFTFERSIISDALQYFNSEDRPVKAKAVSIQTHVKDTKGEDKGNKKREVEVGDPRAEKVITLFFTDNLDEASLRKLAEERLKSYSFTGFTGGFLTFGEPVVDHGGKVTLVDEKLQERSGTYWVKSVVTSFGSNGYKQEIELDRTAL